MNVADFFATKSATPATRSDAEAALRGAIGTDTSSDTPAVEIVSGDGNSVLHDTVVQDTTSEGVGFSGDSVPETTKSCGCPEGVCLGPNPETVDSAMKSAEAKAKEQGVGPGDERFGLIIQGVMDETFGPGAVTVSGPYTEAQKTDDSSIGYGYGEDGVGQKSTNEFDGKAFIDDLVKVFSKPTPESIVKSGRFDQTYRNTEIPTDPFPFFASLGRDEPDFSRIGIQTAARIEQDRLDEEEAFGREARDVVLSLSTTMEQLTRLATQVYGD